MTLITYPQIYLLSFFSGMSFLALIFIILSFFLFKEERVYSKKLILYMTISDAGVPISLLISVIRPIVSDKWSNETLCDVQAYLLIFFMLYSYMWAACFASHLYQLLYARIRNYYLWEAYYHIICLTIPSIACTFFFVEHHYSLTEMIVIGDFDRPWCFVNPRDSPIDWNKPLTWFLNDGLAQQLVFLYLPYVLVLIHNLVFYIFISIKVKDSAMGGVIKLRIVGYIIAYLLLESFSFANRLYQFIGNTTYDSPFLFYMEIIILPLHGFITATFYGFNLKIVERYRLFLQEKGCCVTKDSKVRLKKVKSSRRNIMSENIGMFSPVSVKSETITHRNLSKPLLPGGDEDDGYIIGRYGEDDDYDALDFESVAASVETDEEEQETIDDVL